MTELVKSSHQTTQKHWLFASYNSIISQKPNSNWLFQYSSSVHNLNEPVTSVIHSLGLALHLYLGI